MRIHAIRKMPLSIDEAGSRCTQTPGGSRKEQHLTEENEKGLAGKSKYLRKVYGI
jgi:hypothetical protein